MLNVGRLGSREVMKLQVFDYASKNPVMYFDYANTTTLETTSSRVYAWGAGQRRMAWDGEKALTLTVETQLFSMEHLALIAGEEIMKGENQNYKTETLLVEAGNTITLSKTPVGDVAVFPITLGTFDKNAPQPVDEVVAAVVTLDTGATVQVGDEVQVFYQHAVANTEKIQFTSKGTSGYVMLVGDTLFTDDASGDTVAAQLTYYKAKVQPNISIAMSSQGDPSSISMVFDLFPVHKNGEEVIADITLYEE